MSTLLALVMVATAASAIGPVPGFRPPDHPIPAGMVSVWCPHDTLNVKRRRHPFLERQRQHHGGNGPGDGHRIPADGDTGSVAGAVEMAKLVPVVLRLFLYASPLRSITVATVMLRALDSSRGKRKIFGL